MNPRVLIITHDAVGERMAGPAIRVWEMARRLARQQPVMLTSRLPVGIEGDGFEVASFGGEPATLLAQARAADILIVQGFTLSSFPKLATLGKLLVVDLYDPFIFESYGFYESQGVRRDETYLRHTDVINDQLFRGDFFICASERQRDLWLGTLMAAGRVTPDLFRSDPTARSLIDIVPFGLPELPPRKGAPCLRGVVPGIGDDDFVLLWGGGIWDWFDPLVIIRAIGLLGRPDIKLYFMGLRHPNHEIPEMAMASRAVALARDLGLEGKAVFFNPGWVSYEQRHSYLLESDAGASAHFDSLETRYSFRTRVLDYLWAGLPILSSAGDSMAELVARHDLGEVVAVGDVEGWARSIARLADDKVRRSACRGRCLDAARGFRWEEALKPLTAYCLAPHATPRLVARPGGSLFRSYWGGAPWVGADPAKLGLPAQARRLARLVQAHGTGWAVQKALKRLLP